MPNSNKIIQFYGQDFPSPEDQNPGLDSAREEVGALLGGDPRGVIFTSSGTEALNLALKGIAWANPTRSRLLRSATEGVAVRDSLRFLATQGRSVDILPSDGEGNLDPADLEASLHGNTAFFALAAGSPEIGVLPPLPEIGDIASDTGVPWIMDATLGAGRTPLRVEDWKVTAVALGAATLGAPPGGGVLWVRPGTRMVPLIHGGTEENGLRAGTPNLPAAVALGKAAHQARKSLDTHAPHLTSLADRFLEGLSTLEGCRRTGPKKDRVPGHASVVIAGVDGESLVLDLHRQGVVVSTGSPCSQAGLASPVLTALGLTRIRDGGSLVVTLSPENTREEVDRALELIRGSVGRLRALAPEGLA